MPLTVDERMHYDRLVAEAVRRATSRFSTFFADDGPLARSGYLKHLDFFASGKKFKERLFMAANRVGKSEAGAYELTCHLTGIYPPWWEGRRFEKSADPRHCAGEIARECANAGDGNGAGAPDRFHH